VTLARMSVSKRLSRLVVSELITAAAVVVAAIIALTRLSEQHRYMHEYVFAPLVDIEGAAFTADELLGGDPGPATMAHLRRRVGRLRAFIDRYDRQWKIEGSSLPNARRFRAMLGRAGRLALVAEEREASDAFLAALREIERSIDLPGARAETAVDAHALAALNASLAQLNRVNLRYMEVGYDAYAGSFRSITFLFLAVGLASIAAAPLLGLAVRHAIAPRIAVLVEKVRRFRDLGVNEPIGDWHGDELAVLARALDVSFTAIAARDQEREQFLAIAAHELKTPLTTVKGFAQAALAHRDNAALRDRALSVIDRQATRLAHLVQDLLWSARARGQQLSFQPAPLDLGACTARVIAEVELLAEGRSFPLEVQGDTHILGDAMLVEQSLSSVLMQALSMVPARAPVPVALRAGESSVRVTVEARDVEAPVAELDKLMEPFGVVQFEGGGCGAHRSTGLGLHLAREIARLHDGSLRIEREAGASGLVFVLEYGR